MTIKKTQIEKTRFFVEDIFAAESSGHDWWHIYRVTEMAKTLANKEDADLFICEMAALLHDLDDWKLNGHGNPEKAEAWLKEIHVGEHDLKKILEVIGSVSFKGARVADETKSLEAKVVQDADRIDAIGAIGIARAFAFGGHHQREMYNPNSTPAKHESFQEYKSSKSNTINHFYEKLLLLKNRLHTHSAKEIALSRHEFMETFLSRFYSEWEGEM